MQLPVSCFPWPPASVIAGGFGVREFFMNRNERGCVMRGWRSEAILDVYNLVLGVFLFVSPWLFAYAGSVDRLDAWLTSSVLVAKVTDGLDR